MTIKILASSALLTFSFALLLPGHHVQAQEEIRRIEVVASDFRFTPGDVTVKKGVPVTFALTSKDVDHGLAFKELNVVVKAWKGETREVTFTPDKTGTFIGQCSIFCGTHHGLMKMTLHVTE